MTSYWLKQDLNDYEPQPLEMKHHVIVARLSRLSISAYNSLVALKQRGESRLSIMRWPNSHYYLGLFSGMTGGQVVASYLWLTENSLNRDASEFEEIWGEMDFFVMKKDVYARHSLEFQTSYFDYDAKRLARKYGRAGVLVAREREFQEVLCPAFLSQGKSWVDVRMPLCSVEIMPNSEGVLEPRFL